MNPRIKLTFCQNLSKIGPVVFEILLLEMDNWYRHCLYSAVNLKRVLPKKYIRS